MTQTQPLILLPTDLDRLHAFEQEVHSLVSHATTPPKTEVALGAELASTSVTVDATGVRISGDEEDPRGDIADFVAVDREADQLGSFKISGRPAIVSATAIELDGELEVSLDLNLREVPVEWQTDAAGRLALAYAGSKERHLLGSARVSTSKAKLIELVRQAATKAAADEGFGIEIREIDLTSVGRSVTATLDAKVKKGIISAGAAAQVNVDIDRDLIARIGEIQVTSGNPVVKAVLMALKSKIARYEGKSVDINDRLPAGVYLTDLQFRFGNDLDVEVTLG